MLAFLLATVFAGGETPPPAGEGEIIASADRTVVLPAVQPAAASGVGLPLGARAWLSAMDPSDRLPFAIDWAALLADGEKIDGIARIAVSATGAAVGVEVDQTSGRAPIIDTDGRRTQVWFLVDSAFQGNAAFLGAGVQVGIAMLVHTDSDPFKAIERTAVLTVRQL